MKPKAKEKRYPPEWWKAMGLPAPKLEHPFARYADPPRKFRFDYAWISERIALEVQGGTWINGRHSRGGADHEKMNLAQVMGWDVYQCTPQELKKGTIIPTLKRAIIRVWEEPE